MGSINGYNDRIKARSEFRLFYWQVLHMLLKEHRVLHLCTNLTKLSRDKKNIAWMIFFVCGTNASRLITQTQG